MDIVCSEGTTVRATRLDPYRVRVKVTGVNGELSKRHRCHSWYKKPFECNMDNVEFNDYLSFLVNHVI